MMYGWPGLVKSIKKLTKPISWDSVQWGRCSCNRRVMVWLDRRAKVSPVQSLHRRSMVSAVQQISHWCDLDLAWCQEASICEQSQLFGCAEIWKLLARRNSHYVRHLFIHPLFGGDEVHQNQDPVCPSKCWSVGPTSMARGIMWEIRIGVAPHMTRIIVTGTRPFTYHRGWDGSEVEPGWYEQWKARWGKWEREKAKTCMKITKPRVDRNETHVILF